MVVEPGEEIISRNGQKVKVVFVLENDNLLVYDSIIERQQKSSPYPLKVLFEKDLPDWRKENL